MPPHKSNGWGGGDDKNNHSRCRSSNMYWTREETSFLNMTNKPMIIDSLVHIGHMKGGKPYGLNAVFGDGHVSTTLLTSSPYLAIGINGKGWSTWGTKYDNTVRSLESLQP